MVHLTGRDRHGDALANEPPRHRVAVGVDLNRAIVADDTRQLAQASERRSVAQRLQPVRLVALEAHHRHLAGRAVNAHVGDAALPPGEVRLVNRSRSHPSCPSSALGRLAGLNGTTVLLWLTTGLRRGELLGLMWRDLDRASGRLSVVRSLEETKQGLLLKTPKTARSTRVLAVPQIALDVLHRHELAQKEQRLAVGPAYQDHGLVFPDPMGYPQRPRNVTKAFAGLVVRAGLSPVTIHGLRHTHITELLRAGVHPKVVSERVGHALPPRPQPRTG
jgi:integrase